MYKRKFNVQKNIRYTDERSMMYKGILKIRREAALKYKQNRESGIGYDSGS